MKQAYMIIWISKDAPVVDGEYQWGNETYKEKVFPFTFTGLQKAKRSLSALVAKAPVEWGKLLPATKDELTGEWDYDWGDCLVEY